jgi:hypothetical protein
MSQCLSRRDLIGKAVGAAAFLMPCLKAQPQPRRILLAHGLLGFSKIGSLSYFNGVQGCFGKSCEFIPPPVAPTGSIVERARQLQQAILDGVPSAVLNRGRALHLVAHSMGGLDARYLIAKNGLNRASWFASVTTISTPHRGTPLADIITGQRQLRLSDLKPLEVFATPAYWIDFFKAFGKPVSAVDLLKMFSEGGFTQTAKDLVGYFSQVFGNRPEAFQELTTTYLAKFNVSYPGWEGVPLRSYAGVSNPDQTMSAEFYGPWAVLKSISGNNDGAVPESSSMWPGSTGGVAADHFEEVGLATRFDGFVARKHFPVCDLYTQIDAWQSAL